MNRYPAMIRCGIDTLVAIFARVAAGEGDAPTRAHTCREGQPSRCPFAAACWWRPDNLRRGS